jgi:hypothetical protein
VHGGSFRSVHTQARHADRRPPARICGYFAAFNFVYAATGKKRSWADDKGPIYDLRGSYKKASIAIGEQRGAEHPGLRVPIPAMGLHYIDRSEVKPDFNTKKGDGKFKGLELS